MNGAAATILIVDDEQLNVDYLEQELADWGYRTISARNGPEALMKVAAEQPDLILLDILMPGMDGFTVCQRLKTQETTQLIPVVMMTALGAREDRIKGIEAGADDFLTKPVDPRELYARIQTAVKMKQAVDRLKGQVAPDNTFRREGQYWTIAYQGKVVRMRDSAGLQYIAYLLQYPHRQTHVLELVAAVEGQLESVLDALAGKREAAVQAGLRVQAGLGDAGPLLDPTAKAMYRRRLADLREELDDAQRCHDLGRIAQIEREREFLTQELGRAVGLGGKDRLAASPAERARVNIQRAIKAALEKLSSHHPSLGRYLTETIKTGTSCVYAPELRLPSPLQFC
jgi:DNA-binding response OmpR family regulator